MKFIASLIAFAAILSSTTLSQAGINGTAQEQYCTNIHHGKVENSTRTHHVSLCVYRINGTRVNATLDALFHSDPLAACKGKLLVGISES